MNIRDIARIANVTSGTVSKVLNNYPDISEATRQKVLAVIEENQYSPVTGSRNNTSYSTNKKLNIGLIIESVYNHLYVEMEDIISIRHFMIIISHRIKKRNLKNCWNMQMITIYQVLFTLVVILKTFREKFLKNFRVLRFL